MKAEGGWEGADGPAPRREEDSRGGNGMGCRERYARGGQSEAGVYLVSGKAYGGNFDFICDRMRQINYKAD